MSLGSIGILIVEDSVEIRMMIQQFLELQGFDILGLAGDGEEGLALYRETQPDAVVTDLRMPRMDGLQLVQAIRESDLATPIVVFTAYASGDARLQELRGTSRVRIVSKTNLRDLGPAVRGLAES